MAAQNVRSSIRSSQNIYIVHPNHKTACTVIDTQTNSVTLKLQFINNIGLYTLFGNGLWYNCSIIMY